MPSTDDLPNRFAIIPVFPSTDTKEAICIGPYKEVMEYIPQSVARADAEARLERQLLTAKQIARTQERIRALQVVAFTDSITKLTTRVDSFTTRQRERRRQARERRDAAEAEAQAARIKAALDALNRVSDEVNQHTPTGDLHDLPPKGEPPEVARDVAHDVTRDQGKLPNELVKSAPPDPGTASIDPDKGGIYPQPISVSLNED